MHKLMHNIILLPLCHQQKGEVQLFLCLEYKFNSLHEKQNIKFYHHAVLKLENLASVTSCLEHSSYQVLDMQVVQHTR